MNSGLVEYLKEYMINPDPQYAIMINGKWGCGKTFFIKKWIKEYEETVKKEDKTLTPIYVSLYGLKTVKQVTTAIDKVLYPMLYSKAAKVGKTLFRFASAIVFKQDIDFNGDNKEDMSLGLGLDSLAVLKSDDASIKSDKFLIFDDIERCQIDIKELLGYINYFVEHCNCHVVIIGDESQIEDEEKKVFGKFKEKTIGREFQLKAEVDAAIEYFVKEEPCNEFLCNHSEIIKKIFKLTGCNNLRILRQCLWDFNRLESMIVHRNTEYQEQVITKLLCTFIATYCEFKGNNKETILEWHTNYNSLYSQEGKDTIEITRKISEIQNKYNVSLSSVNIFTNIFDLYTVNKIIEYVITGNPITTFVNELTTYKTNKKPSWEKCSDAPIMSNEEFATFYDELIDDIVNKKILKIRDLGNAIAYVSYYDARSIRVISDTVKDKIKETLPHYLDKYTTLEGCFDACIDFKQGINSFITEYKLSILSELCEDFYNEYNRRMREDKDEMTKLLEGLNDVNCDMLYDINQQALPDRSTTYGDAPIFHKVNIESLFTSLLRMSNQGRQNFNSFIRSRYGLNVTCGFLPNKTQADIVPLTLLKEKIDIEIDNRESVERLSFQMISDSIKRAIEICDY